MDMFILRCATKILKSWGLLSHIHAFTYTFKNFIQICKLCTLPYWKGGCGIVVTVGKTLIWMFAVFQSFETRILVISLITHLTFLKVCISASLSSLTRVLTERLLISLGTFPRCEMWPCLRPNFLMVWNFN